MMRFFSVCPHTFSKVIREVCLKKKYYLEHFFNDFEGREMSIVCSCCGFKLCDICKSEGRRSYKLYRCNCF